MSIRKVKWDNHPILGDLELDFTNPQGRPFENILFAGENGTGKTTILSTISTFLNFGTIEHFDYIEYEANGRMYRATQTDQADWNKEGYHRITTSAGDVVSNPAIYHKSLVSGHPEDVRSYGCVFSKARSDFRTEKIAHTTTKELDSEKHDKDGEENFTSLKQLIVDIDSQDDGEYSRINKENSERGRPPLAYDNFYTSSKMYRFSQAFNGFFDKMRYDGIKNNEGEKVILFVKNGQPIGIDDLSTGEKQIVFRGTYLLKNSKNLAGAAIMIDEPELSMHPKWERKILQYYKGLFTEDGEQTAQLFFATHSDHVLGEALNHRNTDLVIVLKEMSGGIEAERIMTPLLLPVIKSAEINYLAFDIASVEYHNALYGLIEDTQGDVSKGDKFIATHTAYDAAKHRKPTTHGKTKYETLPTAVRNAIHHPATTDTYTEDDLRQSIELLRELLP